MQRRYFVYILTNKNNTVLYTGVTSDLPRRISAHMRGGASVFTRRYNVNKLVYFEDFHDAADAIAREKRLKRWKRSWKNELIEASNPERDELTTY